MLSPSQGPGRCRRLDRVGQETSPVAQQPLTAGLARGRERSRLHAVRGESPSHGHVTPGVCSENKASGSVMDGVCVHVCKCGCVTVCVHA